MPDPFRSREDLPKKKKKKKKGEGRPPPAYHLPMFTHAHTHTHKKNLRSDISDSLTVNWRGEKASPSFLFRIPPNQNLKNAEKPKERLVCPCNAYTTRAPSACASKLLYPQNGGVGAWAIHGIIMVDSGPDAIKRVPSSGDRERKELSIDITWLGIAIGGSGMNCFIPLPPTRNDEMTKKLRMIKNVVRYAVLHHTMFFFGRPTSHFHSLCPHHSEDNIRTVVFFWLSEKVNFSFVILRPANLPPNSIVELEGNASENICENELPCRSFHTFYAGTPVSNRKILHMLTISLFLTTTMSSSPTKWGPCAYVIVYGNAHGPIVRAAASGSLVLPKLKTYAISN